MKLLKYSLIPILALLVNTSSARASLTTFDVSGTLYDGSVLGGTFTLDETSDTLAAVAITLTGVDSGTFDVGGGQIGITGSAIDFGASEGSAGFPSITILLPVTSLVGYDGGPLCSLAMLCNGNEVSGYLANGFDGGNQDHHLAAGSATLAGSTSAVPEPASLTLLGLTVLAIRRRSTQGAGKWCRFGTYRLMSRNKQ